MPAKKQAAKKPSNRQAAYIARNRSELIKMGQEVLAEIGPAATIEELSEYAQVSPTTIYKYFKNKEVLFSEALSQMWHKHCLTLTERASDATRAPAFEPIPAASPNKSHPCGGFLFGGLLRYQPAATRGCRWGFSKHACCHRNGFAPLGAKTG